MPYVTLTDVPGLVPLPGQSIVDIKPVTTAMPELFPGMQFWLTPEAYAAAGITPYKMGPDAEGKYKASLLDQTGRLTWTDTAGVVRHDASTGFGATSNIFMPTLLVPTAGVGGHAALYIDRTITGLYVPASYNSQTGYKPTTAALLTDDFTLINYGSSSADAVGGIFSTGNVDAAMDDAACGMRLGFPSGANGGSIIYQNTSAAADRCTLAAPVKTDVPALHIVRAARNVATGKYDGSLMLATGGVTKRADFSFANPIKWDGLASPTLHWGSQDSGGPAAAGNTRKLQTGARWSRALSDAEIAYLIRWFQQMKGLG